MNLVDSSGWLEYFANGKNADFFAQAIEESEHLVISTINIYEVFKKVLLERGENSAIQTAALMQNAKVIEVDNSIAVNAAKLSCELKIPMADSIILATARISNATLWTQDSDFEGLPNVKYVKKK